MKPSQAKTLSPSFFQLVGRIVRTPDSIPLVAALTTAATMLAGFTVYQFKVRPDFKALRIRSNATDNIDKPIGYHSQRLIWAGKWVDDTPSEIKDIIKSVR